MHFFDAPLFLGAKWGSGQTRVLHFWGRSESRKMMKEQATRQGFAMIAATTLTTTATPGGPCSWISLLPASLRS
jgi:hypothetical protein